MVCAGGSSREIERGIIGRATAKICIVSLYGRGPQNRTFARPRMGRAIEQISKKKQRDFL